MGSRLVHHFFSHSRAPRDARARLEKYSPWRAELRPKLPRWGSQALAAVRAAARQLLSPSLALQVDRDSRSHFKLEEI